MKKKLFSLIVLSCLFIINNAFSSEKEIYKKIDLFGEVLEKINKEYVDEINQFSCRYRFQQNSLLVKKCNKIKII